MTERHRDRATARAATALRLLLVGVAVASLVLGYVGFERYLMLPGHSMYSRAPSDLVYYDIQLFFAQSPPLDQGGPFPWPLAAARFGAPTVLLYAVAEVAAALFAPRASRAWLRRARGHAVVFGSTRAASVLVERLRASGMRVLTVDAGSDDRAAVSGDRPTARRTLADAAVAHAAVVYACLERSEDNSEIAYAVEALRSGRARPERVYAAIDDFDLCTALKARRWSTAGSGRSHVDFFNRDELAGQAVVRRDRRAFEGGVPHVAVCGTGAFARSLLVEFARQWLHRREAPDLVQAVLVGPDATAVAARLYEQYAFLADSCLIEPWPAPLARLFDERRRTAAPRLRRLYLCQPDESEALTDALTCGAYLNLVDGVVVRLDRMSQMARTFHPGPESGTLFETLGGRLQLVDITELGCDPARIGDDLVAGLARAIHRRYLSDQLAAGRGWGDSPAMAHWEDLPSEFRRSNRAQAEDMGRKLAAIGCLLTPRRAAVPPFAFHADEVEQLAETEHIRWSAERAAAGWRLGRDRDDEAKTHPSLVPWPDLPEPEKEKDRQVVRALPELLADIGLAVVRVGARDGFEADHPPDTHAGARPGDIRNRPRNIRRTRLRSHISEH